MTDQPTDQGVSIDEAARILGISREAVRLRIRRRTLAAERHEGVWAVDLDGRSVDPVQRPTRPTDRPTDRPAPRPRPASDALVTALQARIAEQALDLAARRREVEELHILLQRAQGPPLLAAAPTAAPAPEFQPDSGKKSIGRTPTHRRPLWERLLHALREAIATPPG